MFYVITGLIYAKYNLEIINFLFYKIFVINLHERTKRTMVIKITFEVLIIVFITMKIFLYLIEL